MDDYDPRTWARWADRMAAGMAEASDPYAVAYGALLGLVDARLPRAKTALLAHRLDALLRAELARRDERAAVAR